MVLFPGGRLNVRVFERRYMDMVSRCLKTDTPFGVCLIKHGAEVGPAAEPHAVGTTATIVHCDAAQPGVLQVSARGNQRFRVASMEVAKDQLVVADVELLAEQNVAVPEHHRRLADVLRQLLAKVDADSYFPPPQWENAGWVGARLAELLPLPASLKQSLLEIDEAEARLAAVADLLPAT